MGRYYFGDIDGKFWFGVQNSNDASFFGGSESEPSYIHYYFEKSDLPDIRKGIIKCEKALGIYKKKIDVFFKKNDSYNGETLAKALGLEKGESRTRLEWFARLQLGYKILKCVEKNGDCSFDAEL